jgi:hypothetical protein
VEGGLSAQVERRGADGGTGRSIAAKAGGHRNEQTGHGCGSKREMGRAEQSRAWHLRVKAQSGDLARAVPPQCGTEAASVGGQSRSQAVLME